MKNGVYLVIVIVAAVLVGFFVSRYLHRGSGTREDVIVDIDKIKEIAQIATIEYHSTVHEHVTSEHAWYEWKNAELLVIVHGTLMGLIDLEKISMKESGDKAVTITIPRDAVVIKGPIIGPNDIEVITIANPNVFHKINDAQRKQARDLAITHLIKKVMDAGIEQATLEEAQKVIRHFLDHVGFDVQFTAG